MDQNKNSGKRVFSSFHSSWPKVWIFFLTLFTQCPGIQNFCRIFSSPSLYTVTLYIYIYVCVCVYVSCCMLIFLALWTIFLVQDLSLWPMDSPVAAPAQWLWDAGCFSSACGILVSWPGLKFTSPTLQSGFSTTGPPGKSPDIQMVQLLSCVWLFASPWTAAHQVSLSILNSQSLLKLMSIESVIPFNHLILSSPSPPAFFLSIRVFSNESVLHIRWPKHWSFSLSISPSNEYSGLISLRIDWFDFPRH